MRFGLVWKIETFVAVMAALFLVSIVIGYIVGLF